MKLLTAPDNRDAEIESVKRENEKLHQTLNARRDYLKLQRDAWEILQAAFSKARDLLYQGRP